MKFGVTRTSALRCVLIALSILSLFVQAQALHAQVLHLHLDDARLAARDDQVGARPGLLAVSIRVVAADLALLDDEAIGAGGPVGYRLRLVDVAGVLVGLPPDALLELWLSGGIGLREQRLLGHHHVAGAE